METTAETRRGAPRVRVGCCGWSYPEWVGPFYRSSERMFTQYARVFDTAEIDSSFYRIPERKTMEGLARQAPRDFLFTVKVPQALTHEARLRDTAEARTALDAYLHAIEPLRSSHRLRLVLVQLPPSFGFEERGPLERFLRELRDRGVPSATEFRHAGWVAPEHLPDSLALLRGAGSSYTIVDEPLLPPDTHTTNGTAYVRLHGRNPALWYDYDYSPSELAAWKGKVAGLVRDGEEVIVVFNNHPHGNAPRNAIAFRELIGGRAPAGSPDLGSFGPGADPAARNAYGAGPSPAPDREGSP